MRGERGKTEEERGIKKKGGVCKKVKKVEGLAEFLNRFFEKGAPEWRIVKALNESKIFGGLPNAKQSARIRKHAWRLEEAGRKVHYDPEKKTYKVH